MAIELYKEAKEGAVADVQERLQARISEIDTEVHEDEFQYWRKCERQAKPK